MSALLDAVGDVIARETGMTPTQARGTLRLLLKERGVDARIAHKGDVLLLLTGPLEDALTKRRIAVPEGLLEAIRRAVEGAPDEPDPIDLFSDID